MARQKTSDAPAFDFEDRPLGDSLLLFYTSSNNLRHYLSMDSVIGHAYFEAPLHDRCVGTLWDAGLLVVPASVPARVVESFQEDMGRSGSTPVVCILNRRTCSTVPAQIIASDGTIRTGTLADLDAARDQAAAVLGYLPIGWVEKFVFQEEEHLDRFLFLPISNVPVSKSKCAAAPEYFDGVHTVDLEALQRASLGLYQSKVEIQTSLKRRGRLRAALVGALENSGVEVGPAVTLVADADLLEVLHGLAGSDPSDTQSTAERVLSTLEGAVASSIVPMPLKRPPQEGRGILRSLGRLGPWVSGGDHLGAARAAFDEAPLAGVSEDSLDQVAYALALALLADGGQEATAIGDLVLELVEQLSSLLSEIPSADTDRGGWEAILERYRGAARRIGEVSAGLGPALPDLLRKWPSSFGTLKALAILAAVGGQDEFPTLTRKLELMPEAREDPRVLWSLFGAQHGMAGLGAEYKSAREYLDLSEVLTSRWLGDPRLVREASAAVPMGDDLGAPDAASTYSGQLVTFAIAAGVQAPAGRIGDTREVLQRFAVRLLSTKEGERILKDLMMNHEPKADDFCCVSGETTEIRSIRLDPETNRLRVEFKGRQFEVRWADWGGFRRTLLEDRRGFQSLSRESLSSLAEEYQRRAR